jgi:oligopeptide/dipeptide ABC transporter ATP-binding protein
MSAPAVERVPAAADRAPLLSVRNLAKHYERKSGLFGGNKGVVKAVDGVSFQVFPGETLGLVGESGCGKTTTGRAVLRLIEPTAGEVVFEGQDVLGIDAGSLRRLRRRMQIIFQDPFSSLNPRMTIGAIVREGITIHRIAEGEEADRRVKRLLEEVGLRPEYAKRYPHEFSGGQRQRVGIARALSVEPSFIVCDEPVSALDVSVQAQVINLLQDLQRDRGLAYLFIAHDLSVVRHLSDRIAVMYLGRIVEVATREQLYRDPRHPYTKALLAAVPIPDPVLEASRPQQVIAGEVPSVLNPPSGCPFHPRCPVAESRCVQDAPALRVAASGRSISCHLATV